MTYVVTGIAIILLVIVALYALAKKLKPKAEPICMSCEHLEYRRRNNNGRYEYFCEKYGKTIDPADYCQKYEKRDDQKWVYENNTTNTTTLFRESEE